MEDQRLAKLREARRVDAPDAVAIVKAQREKDFKEIASHEAFLEASKTTHAKEIANILHKKDLEIKDEELNRQWEEYLLRKKKEEIDYRVKQEKGLTKQRVLADIKQTKREIAIKRYGHLYKKDENGDPIDFTVSTFINKYEEVARWYKSLTDNTRRIINTTVKFIFRISLTGGLVYLAYRVLQWLVSNGVALGL